MKINDYDRISSFMNELAGVELDVRPLQKRMLDCEMPGTYDVDFVGVTFEKMRLLSMTVYLLASEPSADERMYQRLAAYEYLSSILPRVSFEGAFAPDEAILEGMSVNESGTVSTRKRYFCVDGDFSWRLPNRKFLNPKDFGMEVHYRASEQSDYGADYKLYFVNRPKSA